MTLHPVKLNPRQTSILKKKKLDNYEQIVRFPPNKYFDCREATGLCRQYHGMAVTIFGKLDSMRSSVSASGMLTAMAFLTDQATGLPFRVTWFHSDYAMAQYEGFEGSIFVVVGNLSYTPEYGYGIPAPYVFEPLRDNTSPFVPQYKSRSGIAASTYKRLVKESVSDSLVSPFSFPFIRKNGLLTDYQAGKYLHYPENEEQISMGTRHFALQHLTYFALHMLGRKQTDASKVPCVTTDNLVRKAISGLPYALTKDQSRVVMEITEKLKRKETVNALVQGDVSCGKTITAFLLLILAAENGYQSVLMAPTVVLASQHYGDLQKLLEPYGLKCAFLNATLSKKERAALLKGLETGGIDILVGTHAAAGPEVHFKNLGLVVIDEEQRFGVEKREELRDKADIIPAYFSMSATPIPRSLALSIFGEDVQTFTIKSMPSGRQPVDTLLKSRFCIPSIVISELGKGRQAYVVCPLIDKNEDNPAKQKVYSIEETVRIYERELGSKYRIGILNGKMKEKEMMQVLEGFMNGSIDVLISTTVIEVGVNNPNASVIVIQNAERFGLSTLHQLRGRVRRGSFKPYCVLVSETAGTNARLLAMRDTEDGFKIAEMDLRLRKSGDLCGTEQSGSNLHTELLLRYPDMYAYAQLLAKGLIDCGEDKRFMEVMDGIYGKEEAGHKA